MFRRFHKIALTAGASVALIAAMGGQATAGAQPAGPAGTRSPAGTAASTPVPVDITGNITWTLDHEPSGPGFPNLTGDDKETGTFQIDLTNVTNGGQTVGGNSSTYSVTDNLNWTFGGPPGCTVTDAGSYSGGGPLLYSPTTAPTPPFAYMSLAFNPSLTAMSANIFDTYTENATRTFTGSGSGCTGSVPEPLGPEGQPGCLDSSGDNLGLNGSLNGTYPNATVDLGCSGTYTGGSTFTGGTDTGSFSVTGTLTITPSCGSGGSASPGDLCITSPPANSIIAATDGLYLQPQPGPNDRQPEARHLIVEGIAPASDSSVTVNGQQVPVSGGEWSAEVPVTAASLGQLTLTASDANTSVDETITLIDLQITSPTEDASLPITAQPAMPDLNATASALGYSGDTSNASFDWTLDMRGEYIDRIAPHWHSYPQLLITGSETGTATPWNLPLDSPIVGGAGRLSVVADLPGVLDDPVQSEPRWIDIPGTNPAPAAVNSEVESLDSSDADTIEHIFCYESGGQGVSYPQFNSGPNTGEPAFPDVPADWTPNPPVMQPNYGAPPAGIGIAQLDPAIFPEQQWNWQENVTGGVQVYQQGLAAAKQLRSNEQARLHSEWQAALTLVNATRAAHNPPLPPVTVPLKAVPAEPAPYSGIDGVIADAITRSNTGAKTRTGLDRALFYFDYHYLASTDNLHVLTQGSGTWVEQDGNWQSAHQWQANGGIHTARVWIDNLSWDPSYPDHVENCTPPQ